jgi:hypothetical protein
MDNSVYGGPADAMGPGDLAEALSTLAVLEDSHAI